MPLLPPPLLSLHTLHALLCCPPLKVGLGRLTSSPLRELGLFHLRASMRMRATFAKAAWLAGVTSSFSPPLEDGSVLEDVAEMELVALRHVSSLHTFLGRKSLPHVEPPMMEVITMELHKIKQVTETHDVETVNKMLENGWVLLEVYKADNYGGPYPLERAYYVLGREESSD